MSNPGNYGRNRFGGIGAGVIRYPYEEIADYIAYDWALDSIGGEGEAAKWSKYDNAFEVKLREARKKGLSATEAPTRAEVYTEKMNTATDNFTRTCGPSSPALRPSCWSPIYGAGKPDARGPERGYRHQRYPQRRQQSGGGDRLSAPRAKKGKAPVTTWGCCVTTRP